MIELCASVLAANHAHIARDLAAAEACGIQRFHFDVCDGHYTRNIIFGSQLIEQCREESISFFDVHLAVYEMERIMDTFLTTGCDMISLQYECSDEPERLLQRIHDRSLKAGLCITPETSAEQISNVAGHAENINVLAVNPGIGGQRFQRRVLEKIERLADLREHEGLAYTISVDGGVNAETLGSIMDAGADIAIAGSAVFEGSIEENILTLRDIIQKRSK